MVMNIRVSKNAWSFWQPEEISASQAAVCFMNLV
jgi:hypothetical protein